MFQFTHPGKGATSSHPGPFRLWWFQFTHPGKGATQAGKSQQTEIESFNSRTLGRVRLVSISSRRFTMKFQFTHPGKGATSFAGESPPIPPKFQFTHPGKGATLGRNKTSRRHWGFNSRTLGRVRRGNVLNISLHQLFQFTHPGKGATVIEVAKVQVFSRVSIHAPWEGCD